MGLRFATKAVEFELVRWALLPFVFILHLRYFTDYRLLALSASLSVGGGPPPGAWQISGKVTAEAR